MKHSMSRAALAAAVVFIALGAVVPAAFPQTADRPPGPQAVPHGFDGPAGPGAQLPPHGLPRPGAAFGPPGPGPAFGPLGAAARLAAAEIYLGITQEQFGAWRTYTAALIALLDAGPDGHADRGPVPAGKPNGAVPPPGQGPAGGPGGEHPDEPALPGEQIADHILAAADKAKTLKAAAAALKPTLSSDQADKLRRIEGVLFGPPHGPEHPFVPQPDARD